MGRGRGLNHLESTVDRIKYKNNELVDLVEYFESNRISKEIQRILFFYECGN